MKILDRTLRSVAVGRRFAPQLAEHKRSLATVVVLSLVSTALELARPWPLKWILDEALVPASEPVHGFWFVVGSAAGVLLVISLGRAGLEYLRALKLAEIGHKVTRTIRTRIFAHLADLSPRFHARHKSGDLLMRLMGDVPMLRTMLVDSSMELATRGLLVAGMLTWMFSKDPLLTSVLLAVLPALFLTVRFISRRITAAVRKQRKKEGLLADFLHEAVAASSTIQALGREKDTVRRFARDNRSSARAGLKATRLAARLSATVESMLGVVMAGTLAFGAWRVSTGELTLGELTWFLSYVRGMLKPIRSAARHGERVGKGTACGERILEVLDEDIAVRSAPGAPSAPDHPRTLGFERVTFAYEDGERALDGFSATLDAGELVGVFGRSGAGKSTMAALGLRLYDPDAGTVRLDGVDIRAFDLESLRGRFALCMQETVLFGDTIRENLLLGRPDAEDDQLWQALEDAAAAEFVRDLPEGMDTQLGSAGVGLSGGQRHRIALARTLLRASPIVILDEPFSGLDRAAVERLCSTLRSRCKDGLVVIITHEREHLDTFDRVLFVEAGQLVGAGPHRTLLARQGAYRDVVGAHNGSGR